MSALPPEQMREMRETAIGATRPIASLAERWQHLHEQAGRLAELAQLGKEAPHADSDAFSETLTGAMEWQRELAWQGIEDIDAMMQPGLTALQVIAGRGQDVAAPALALWREFHAAREAVLTVLLGEASRDAA